MNRFSLITELDFRSSGLNGEVVVVVVCVCVCVGGGGGGSDQTRQLCLVITSFQVSTL